MKNDRIKALKKVPSNYNFSNLVHSSIDESEQSSVIRPKFINIDSRLTDLYKKKEENINFDIQNNPLSYKSDIQLKNIKLKKGLFFEVHDLLSKINDKTDEDHVDYEDRLNNDYRCLFSYENFMLLNNYDKHLLGENILELKKEKLRNLFKGFDNKQIKGKYKNDKIHPEVTPAAEKRQKCVLPKIIYKCNNDTLSSTHLFKTELKSNNPFIGIKESVNVSGNSSNNFSRKDNLVNELNFDSYKITEYKQVNNYNQFPNVLKIKTTKFNLFPSINNSNRKFYTENAEILNKLKFFK